VSVDVERWWCRESDVDVDAVHSRNTATKCHADVIDSSICAELNILTDILKEKVAESSEY